MAIGQDTGTVNPPTATTKISASSRSLLHPRFAMVGSPSKDARCTRRIRQSNERVTEGSKSNLRAMSIVETLGTHCTCRRKHCHPSNLQCHVCSPWQDRQEQQSNPPSEPARDSRD